MIKGLLTLLIAANTKGFDAALGRSGKALKGFAATAKAAVLALGPLVIIMAAVQLGRNVTKKIIEFDKAITGLTAILGKSRAELAALEQQAISLGGATVYTATEVAGLQTVLARFGFDTKEIEDSTAAILDLAAAAGIEVVTAADTGAATLRAFNLQASEMTRVVDTMANAFTKSALDVDSFAQAMVYAAPIAQSAGASLEETSGILAILADNGIRGSIAGTSLRRIFTNLAQQGKTMSQIFKESAGSIEEMGDAMGFAKDQVGQYALSSFLVLARNAELIEETTEAMSEQGTAARVAATQLESLSAKTTILNSAWERLIITVDSGEGAFGKFLGKAIEGLTELLNLLAGVDDGVHGIQLTTEELRNLARATQEVGQLDLSNAMVFDTGNVSGWDLELALEHWNNFHESVTTGQVEMTEKEQTLARVRKEQEDILNRILGISTAVAVKSDEQIALQHRYNNEVKVMKVEWSENLDMFIEIETWVKKLTKAEKERAKVVKEGLEEEAKLKQEAIDKEKTAYELTQEYLDQIITDYNTSKGWIEEITYEWDEQYKVLSKIIKLVKDPDFGKVTGVTGASSEATTNADLDKIDEDTTTAALEAQMQTYEDWGDTISGVLMQTADSWQDYAAKVGQSLLKMAGDFLIYTIKKQTMDRIQSNSNSATAASSAVKTGAEAAESLPPWVGLIALPALIALALGAVTAGMGKAKQAKPFADGGIVSGTTYGMLGEYGNASTNPEVVAPLDKLRSLMGDIGGGGGKYELILKNRTLVAAMQRETTREKRYGAR